MKLKKLFFSIVKIQECRTFKNSAFSNANFTIEYAYLDISNKTTF